ncbi:MAG: FAD:protein FMN transferase [Candidatus Aureabacteria bacterium]|nr:FAD:protein FMN transferase [Candidatus Auribacterota bacterium]
MFIIAVLLLIGAVLICRPSEWSYSIPAMGATATVTVVGTPLDAATGRLKGAADAACAEIRRCEELMSIFRGESDIGRLNRSRPGDEVEVDPRTHEVLAMAIEASRRTGGAFNICVLPAEERWGFKKGARRAPPTPGRTHVPPCDGSTLVLEREGRRCFAGLRLHGVRIDLGGIAPGYAADRAADLLRERGVKGALVDVGGECRCLGGAADGGPWRVAVRHPRRDGVLATLQLSDRAVATSGDYEDYFIEKGRRYSHIFDPRTGSPAESGVASATVVADSCAEADALSTAMLVMGVDAALTLARGLSNVECLLAAGEGEPAVSSSPGMNNYIARER